MPKRRTTVANNNYYNCCHDPKLYQTVFEYETILWFVDELVELGVVDSISYKTVRRTLETIEGRSTDILAINDQDVISALNIFKAKLFRSFFDPFAQ